VSEDHYFSADPAVPFAREPLVAEVWGRRLALTSGSGVFARGRLDGGTAVLFRETEPPIGGRILDLGCGYGVIGLAIAACSPDAVVTGVDVNRRAVLLATENAATLGVSDRYAALTPDDVPADATYDEIWSNPPSSILHSANCENFPKSRRTSRVFTVAY
jgi:16S rRNA G1207 methylase RsmC